MGEGLSPMGGGAISEGRGVISDGDDEQLLLLLRGAGGSVTWEVYCARGRIMTELGFGVTGCDVRCRERCREV